MRHDNTHFASSLFFVSDCFFFRIRGACSDIALPFIFLVVVLVCLHYQRDTITHTLLPSLLFCVPGFVFLASNVFQHCISFLSFLYASTPPTASLHTSSSSSWLLCYPNPSCKSHLVPVVFHPFPWQTLEKPLLFRLCITFRLSCCCFVICLHYRKEHTVTRTLLPSLFCVPGLFFSAYSCACPALDPRSLMVSLGMTFTVQKKT